MPRLPGSPAPVAQFRPRPGHPRRHDAARPEPLPLQPSFGPALGTPGATTQPARNPCPCSQDPQPLQAQREPSLATLDGTPPLAPVQSPYRNRASPALATLKRDPASYPGPKPLQEPRESCPGHPKRDPASYPGPHPCRQGEGPALGTPEATHPAQVPRPSCSARAPPWAPQT
ncbi:uncharacterized protein [Oryctolagus cuniculus]|uniref:uncharacterized protein n=1 Tax=Oryctolagus cuniculus TaxID=9986 RepID=UPI00387A6358